MTTAALQLNDDARWLARAWHHAVVIPARAVGQWAAVALITSGTLYGSVAFNMLHGVFPVWIAVPLGIGIEWTYLSGLAYATALRSNRWSSKMIVAGAITSGLYGVLYILGHYKVIPASPTPEQAIWLALAHIVPLIVLLFLYTLCKRDYLVEARAERETAAAAAQLALDAQAALKLEWQRQQLELETAQRQLEIEAGHVKLERARAKIGGGTPAKTYQCPSCGKQLTAQQHSVNQRYGGACKECRHT